MAKGLCILYHQTEYEELKEHELNLQKVIENLPMDEDFRDLLAVLINSYFSFAKNSERTRCTASSGNLGQS